jgi:hypothetical protein
MVEWTRRKIAVRRYRSRSCRGGAVFDGAAARGIALAIGLK